VLEMDFYGRALEIPRLDLDGVRLAGRIDEKVISGFWETMSGLPHDDLLTHAATLAEDLHLNDWGRLLLLNGIAHGQFEDRNLIVLATWFYLLKSGYDARIGFWEGRVYLMLPAEQKIYGHTNFTLEGCRYYVVEPGGGASKPQKLMIFEGDYPGARRALDLRLAELPRVGNDPYSRELRFAFAGKDYAFDLRYDNRAIEFLASFPLTDLDVYFTAPISGDLSRTLLGALRPALDGLSIRESVDLLLRLVQTGFAYKTDGDQFGREKYMFPEELLFFPYSDCEDRSVLFHYLVETLLGLDVVGLAYPGHVATAVDFQRTQVGGDALTYDNRRYVICDPTYINAGAGMCMPRFQGTSPEVLNFE